MNVRKDALKDLVTRFDNNITAYKDGKNAYNEHSCRIEYIDPFLQLLGWDVPNKAGLAPQYREVIAENYSNKTDRPDYSLTLRGVTKLFVEAKKPSVDIDTESAPAMQARKYGWNAKHKISILTNFEYFIIYDTTTVPKETDDCRVSRYRCYHYKDYIDKFDEIFHLVSKDSVYSGEFDKFFNDTFKGEGSQKQQVDNLFLNQINDWRVKLSNELYSKGNQYTSLEKLNDVVQEFINQIVFLRICEDRNLPLYHKLNETISDRDALHTKLEELFREADKRYNSGMFSGENIIFDLNNNVIVEMIEGLYYPQSPYMFNIIEPNMLGKIYELFLTEQLILLENGRMGLAKKKDCANRSVVTTPTEIVKYMVEKSLSNVCKGKSPAEICNLRIADIACGSGVYLEEAFQYLQAYCVEWYLTNEPDHLIEIGNGKYKLPLDEKKQILCSCIFGIDIDIHAVEVAKFSLLIKLIENETEPSVRDTTPILPELSSNILHGNALVGNQELAGKRYSTDTIISLVPYDWDEMPADGFDVILGNPPYVTTEDMHQLLSDAEFTIYKNKYKSSHKQFDKYFIFLERALQKVKNEGYVCYIVPNKFFKISAGAKLRGMLSNHLISLDDFGAAQLFEDKTIYSSIVLLQKRVQERFTYTNVDSANDLWLGKPTDSIELNNSSLNDLPWKLSPDFEFLATIKNIESVCVSLEKVAEIFNGIQTSAERPKPIYWFSGDEIINENDTTVTIQKGNKKYEIEKSILKPYFKPTKATEKGLTTYTKLSTDKRIIFPYDKSGHLISIERMQSDYPGAFAYLSDYYDRLVPKSVSSSGKRDVPNATADTWYQYGRTQALTAFINTPKLIVKVMAKDNPMYALDNEDMLIASGGTAGYCAVAKKNDSSYELEYIQACLANSYTERIIQIVGSDFEGGFVSRGTFVLSSLPFVQLDFNDSKQKALYDRVVEASREVYSINDMLDQCPPKQIETTLVRQKDTLIKEIDGLVSRVYRLDF